MPVYPMALAASIHICYDFIAHNFQVEEIEERVYLYRLFFYVKTASRNAPNTPITANNDFKSSILNPVSLTSYVCGRSLLRTTFIFLGESDCNSSSISSNDVPPSFGSQRPISSLGLSWNRRFLCWLIS